MNMLKKRLLILLLTSTLAAGGTVLPVFAADGTQVVTDVEGDSKARALLAVVRDDRSEAAGQQASVSDAKYYYDMILLDEKLGSAAQINAAIAAHRDHFFSLPENMPAGGTGSSYVRLRDLYMDDRLLSVNLVHYRGGGDKQEYYGYCGYTFDLGTGAQASLAQVLNVPEESLPDMIWNRLQECRQTNDILLPADRAAFDADPDWHQYHYSIREDGRVYVMYDKYQVAPGEAGSVEIYLTDVPAAGEQHYIRQPEDEEIEASKYFLTRDQINEIHSMLGGLQAGAFYERTGWVYLWEGTGLWMTPVEFYDGETEDLVSACDYSTRTGDMKSVYVTGW